MATRDFNADQYDDISGVAITPYLRIIPNGFIPSADGAEQAILKATVLVAPVYSTTGLYMSLQSWPSVASDLLKKMISGGANVRFQKWGEDGPEAAVETDAISHAKKDFPELFSQKSAELGLLWRRSIVPDADADADTVWLKLGERITRIQSGSQVTPSAGLDTRKADPQGADPGFDQPEFDYGGDGQFRASPPADERECDSIIGMAQSDAALFLERERAREIVKSIAAEGSQSKELPETEPPLSVTVEEAGDTGPDSDTLKDYKIARHKALVQSSALTQARIQAREQYLVAVDALTSRAAPVVCPVHTGLPRWAGAGSVADINHARIVSEYGSWPHYCTEGETDPCRDAGQVETPVEAWAGQAYFGLEGNPSLARAFGLAFDLQVAFDVAALDGARYGVLSIRLDDTPLPDGLPEVRTLFKLSKSDSAQSAYDFGWPTTDAEYRLWQQSKDEFPNLPAHCIPQFDGVMVMGAQATPESRPRFDIATLDVGAALEAERAWREAVEDLAEEVAALGAGAHLRPEHRARSQMLSTGPDYQSNGLTLLNRSAVGDAIRKIAATQVKLGARAACAEVDAATGQTCIVHDAEDVTSGYRLLVTRPTLKNNVETWEDWRSLMARSFEFDRTGKGGDLVEQILKAAVGSEGEAERISLESAMVAQPTRDIVTSRLSAVAARQRNVETIVSEVFSQWDGTPSGVASGVVHEQPDLRIYDTNCFGRRASIPGAREIDKPAFLRNGFPYRYALQAVYSGGRSVEVGTSSFPTEADLIDTDATPSDSKRPHDDVRARLFYPSVGQVVAAGGGTKSRPFQRALRHARIGTPTILLPSGHARRSGTTGSNPPHGAMGFDSVGRMIIRKMNFEGDDSVERRERTRAWPSVSQRIVLVPGIPQDMAARHIVGGGQRERHGVFDKVNTRSGPPPGALKNVVYSASRGHGFPVARTTTTPGIDGAPHLVRRDVQSRPDPAATTVNHEEANAIYDTRRSGRVDTTYYPDPAAECLVLRLRRGGGEIDTRPYLEGRPLCIPVAATRYPEAVRVILSLRRSDERAAGRPATHECVLHDLGRKPFSPRRTGDIVGVANEAHFGTEVALKMRPGEHFELEMWYVPSEWRLAHDFAVVQAMAQFFSNLGGASGDCSVKSLLAGIDRSALTADQKQEAVEALRGVSDGDAGARYFGPGGDLLPGTDVLKCLGRLVRDHMLQHPVPEIAGVKRIEAIYAVNRADAAPRLRAPDRETSGVRAALRACANAIRTGGAGDIAPICAFRPAQIAGADAEATPDAPPDAPPGATCAIEAEDPSDAAPGAEPAFALSEIVIGSKNLALGGEVGVDLEQIDTLEITARTVSPDSAVFDDPSRGRSLAHRLAGTWPDALASIAEAKALGEASLRPRQAEPLFGFRLARDGRVHLPEGRIVLLRIDNIPPPAKGATKDRLDLTPYFLGLNCPGSGEVSRRHVFPDGKARRLRLTVNGLARTAEMLATAPRRLQSRDPWLTGSGIVYEAGELIPSDPVPEKHLRRISNEIDIVMPASVRPATVVARAPVPVLETETTTAQTPDGPTIEIVRRARTRIPLARGWYSSGVDERLGLVLWPPGQMLSDHPLLAENKVPLRAPPDGAGADQEEAGGRPERVVPLEIFEDDDLGPGGRFVTRRGMDPVRLGEPEQSGARESQLFLSKEAFPDLLRHPDDANRAEYVPHALMPLLDSGEESPRPKDDPQSPKDETRPRPDDQLPPMHVGLVTYVPRFDPEREEWYVDVLLAPGARADSMVRFGLVRYQPHTRQDLRTSRPVVQWAQPLPERRVRLRYLPGREALEISMSGPLAFGRMPEPTPTPDAGDWPLRTQEEERAGSVMRITAFRDGAAAGGTPTRVTLSLEDAKPENADSLLNRSYDPLRLELRPEVEDGIGRWVGIVPVAVLLNETGDTLSDLSLAIDEIEYFLPASFGRGNEPLDLAFMQSIGPSHWREAGARFSTTAKISAILPELAKG